MLSNYGLPKKLLKLGLNQVQNCAVLLGRLAGVIDFPVPPNSSIRKTGGKAIWDYYLGGLRIFHPIYACARREGIRLDENIRVLDFGCGVARPLLHFTRNCPAPSFYACDVDDTSVAFVQKNYPRVKACVSRFSPPLPYESGSFDLVYAVSVFSHLSPEDQGPWLKELARVIKPGGWCFLTTEGYTSIKYRCKGMDAQEATLRAHLDREGFYYKEYGDWRENVRNQDTLRVTSLMVGIDRSYGSTILSPGHIRRNWPAAGFEVRAVVEGIVDGHDLVELRRLSGPGVSSSDDRPAMTENLAKGLSAD
ncbi:MAG: class I SAM-dependent methyltransferase [Verrucomicrobiota bacterium]|jgi:SAM-dependent methyltransferase